METERVLSKIRAGTARQASNTSTSKNTRSLMKHNNVNLGEISATEADAKELRAKRKVHVAAIRSLKAQGLTPDLEGIRDHLSERLAQALAKEAREAEEQEAAERRAHEEHEKKEKRDIRAAKKRYLEALQVTDQVLWVAEQLMRQLSIQADTSLGRAKSKLMAWILNQEAVTVAEVKELCFNVPYADTFEKCKVVTASLTKLPQVKARALWHAWVGDGLGSELALKDLRDLLKEMSKDMDVDEVENSLSKLP